MSDENTNQEGTKPKGTSEDDILGISAYGGRENLIPVEGSQDAKDKSSDAEFAPSDMGFGKIDDKKTYFETCETNKTASGNLQKDSNSSPQKKKRRIIPYMLITLALIAIVLVSAAAILNGFGIGENLRISQKVAVIYVQGTIMTGSVPAGLGYATSEEISENIRSAMADKDVKAIVLRINSPGGSPAAAQEIVEEIKKAQAHGIPVVVSMGDSATSAAYYIAAPANYIMANPSTVTGSIGVIWIFQNMSAAYQNNGTDYQIVKSGELKDMGSPWRGLTDKEKEYANTVVMEVYEDFVTEVSKGRDINRSEVKALADGRIYTGERAKELQLVDGFGDLYDAIDKAAELGKVTGEPKIVYMNKINLSKLILGSNSEQASSIEQFVSYFEKSPYGKLLA
jgi:protease IV